VIVINAHSGIEVNTRRVFDEAGKAGLGRMIVINKMDGDNIDFPGLLETIRELWGNQCVLLNVPVGQGADFRGVVSTLRVPDDTSGALVDPQEIHDPLIESIIEVDEAVMERYLEGQPPTDDELSRLIVRAVAGQSDPDRLLLGQDRRRLDGTDGRRRHVRSVARRHARKATQDGQEIAIEPKADGPLVAQVFKTRIDPFVQKLSFIRIFPARSSGTRRSPRRPVPAKASSWDRCCGCRPAIQTPASTRRVRATSSRSPRWKNCTPAPRWATTSCPDLVPHAHGRPGRDAQEPRGRDQAVRRPAQGGRRGSHDPASTATRRPRNW
jgi:hypothetical protein